MIFYMKTTLIISDPILKQIKEESARQGRTISDLVESALRLYLEKRKEKQRLPRLPGFKGGRCSVDVSDRDALDRAMEGR